MKAIMSNTLREIINDPKKNEKLQRSISKIHGKAKGSNEETVSIGGKTYKIQLINRSI